MKILNAGLRLWDVQKAQGTGLCIGLDPHYDSSVGLDEQFYAKFADPGLTGYFFAILTEMKCQQIRIKDEAWAAIFFSGVTNYFIRVVDAAWACGLRSFKPQSAFYERFNPLGSVILSLITNHVEYQRSPTSGKAFTILDAKRGDIMSTQEPYYATYLSGLDKEVVPGINGQFDFDTMTVTTWMGEDVLSPGLPYFRDGKGAIVVTRSSNPSGTTLQDAVLSSNDEVELTNKQKEFRFFYTYQQTLRNILSREPTAHECMLFITEKFSEEHGLNQEKVSPIFSVMGSTVKMQDSFRKIRPYGIALVPGFGEQGGAFANVMPLLIKDGPLAGHIGILSSSRAHNYPWMKKYGGSGNPKDLESEMARVIDKFRQEEKQAHATADVDYPF